MVVVGKHACSGEEKVKVLASCKVEFMWTKDKVNSFWK